MGEKNFDFHKIWLRNIDVVRFAPANTMHSQFIKKTEQCLICVLVTPELIVKQFLPSRLTHIYKTHAYKKRPASKSLTAKYGGKHPILSMQTGHQFAKRAWRTTFRRQCA